MQKDEAEDEVEEEPDVDGLDVGGLRHDRREEDVEGGKDGHAGDVCRYDRLKEFFPVNVHRRLVDNVYHHGRQICCDQQAIYCPLQIDANEDALRSGSSHSVILTSPTSYCKRSLFLSLEIVTSSALSFMDNFAGP